MVHPDLTTAARAGQLGTLFADNPSWTDRLAGGFSNAMGALGATPQGQRNAYDIGQKVSGLIPGVGQVLSGNEAYRGYLTGDYPRAIMGAVGAMPIPGASVADRTIADVLKEAEPIGGKVIMEGGTPGLLAYHGSRHDFPSFDMNQIGQGEGAQAYGHGLYFAEHPNVAEGYRTAGAGQGSGEGYKYQVGIAHDPDKFFDLDANFGDQHPDTQKAMNAMAGRKFPKDLPGSEVYDHLIEGTELSHAPSWTTGVSADSYAGPDAHVELANQLNKAGVPGIRYLDEGSRSGDFGPDLLSSYPQAVQDSIKKLYPDANPNMAMNDIHAGLHRKMLDDSFIGLNEDDIHDDRVANAWMGDYNKQAKDALLKAGAKLPPQTRNYVTFSDKNINILKKWGAGGALLAGSTGAASAQDFYQNHPDLERFSLTDSADGQ